MEFLKLLNNIIWSTPTVFIFCIIGIYFSIRLGFFQFNLPRLFKDTFFSSSHKKGKKSNEESGMTPFQTLASTLAVTLGTGNIVAVGTAVAVGGAGSLFWMMVCAFLGMATTYAENYLGMKYRRKGKTSGAFEYIKSALGSKWSKVYAFLTLLAGFGMGGATQSEAMSSSLNATFGTPKIVSGIIMVGFVSLLIYGGTSFFGKFSEKIVPLFSFVYIFGCIAAIFLNSGMLIPVFKEILRNAFDFGGSGAKGIIGGFLGSNMARAMSSGTKRGIFSNEAGLGTSVFWSGMSNEKSCEKQAKWAALAVFFDTIVVCTMTGLVILTSGITNGASEDIQVASAFSEVFGKYAAAFIAICTSAFAICTAGGWSVFVKKCSEYLVNSDRNSNKKKVDITFLFSTLFIASLIIGAVAEKGFALELADLFNGLMIVPNLLAIVILRKQVKAARKK